jgi:hypothetical protein
MKGFSHDVNAVMASLSTKHIFIFKPRNFYKNLDLDYYTLAPSYLQPLRDLSTVT